MLSRVIRVIVFITLIFTCSYSAWSANMIQQQNEVPFFKGDRLRVQGFHGNIVFKTSKNSKIKVLVKIEQGNLDTEELKDRWRVQLKRENESSASLVRLFVQGPEDKRVWAENLREKSLPQIHFTVFVPNLKLEVFWRKGDILIPNWDNDLKVHLLEGKLNIKGGTGATEVVHHRGKLFVTDRKGTLNIESYLNDIVVSKHTGLIKLSNFEGKTRVENSNGQTHITQNKGSIDLLKNVGELEFKNKSAKVKIIDFEGGIRGRSDSGAIYADLKGELKFNVKTKQGGVRLKLKNSGSYMNLGTKQGSLFTPKYLRVTRYSNIKVIKGRLRGHEKGMVFVRTESGNIQIL